MKTIDTYIQDNPLNSRLYEVLLYLYDTDTCESHKLNRKPLEVFEQAYAICEKLQKEKHPEEATFQIWERLRKNFLLCETHIIFSCVYVILFFSEQNNPNMKYCLRRIRQGVDKDYFQEFAPLIREELTHIATTTNSFDVLKKHADQIKDLETKKYFFADCLTLYKQAKSEGNLQQQIADELDFLNLTEQISYPTTATSPQSDCLSEHSEKPNVPPTLDIPDTTPYLKVRSVVILELLRELNAGKAHNDLTKISRLIAFLTDNSYHSIRNDLQRGITFSKYHTEEIDEVNKILADLINVNISIDKNRQY